VTGPEETGGPNPTLAAVQERFRRVLTLEEEARGRADPPPAEEGPSQDDMDALYARDMYELTPEERDRILHDIHGVASPSVLPVPPASDGRLSLPQDHQQPPSGHREQDREWVRDRRQRLRAALMEADTRDGTAAYSRAIKEDASYVQSAEDVELPFLRSAEWDPHLAAQKVLAFLEVKLRLFGPERLVQRRIRLRDLSREDRRCLESGIFQLWPVRDVAGRAIMVTMPMCCSSYQSIDNLVRSSSVRVCACVCKGRRNLCSD
jgi:hypothetical protein